MNSDERYFRMLETSLQLVAFCRDRQDEPEHVLVSHVLYTVLSAMAFELDQTRLARLEPSVN